MGCQSEQSLLSVVTFYWNDSSIKTGNETALYCTFPVLRNGVRLAKLVTYTKHWLFGSTSLG